MTLKKYINLKIIGFVILLWLLFQIDLGQVVDICLKSRLVFIGWALLFMTISVYVKLLRYQYILIQQGVKNSFMSTTRFSLAAMYLSFVTPGRIGEVSKAYFIHKKNRCPLNKLLAGSLMDRIFDIYTLLVTAILGIAVMNPFGVNPFLMIMTIIVIASIPFVFLIRIIREMFVNAIVLIQRKFTNLDTWSDHLRSFFDEINSLLNQKMFWGFAASFTAYALFFGSCYFLSRSIDVPLSYLKVAIFIASASILSFLPISFAGIGTREACLVYLFSTESLSGELALAFSTLVFSITYLFFGIIGFFCFITLKYNKGSLINNA